MGKNVKAVQRKIFDDLSNRLINVERTVTSNKERWIYLNEKEYDVIEHAKVKVFSMGKEAIMAVIDYEDKRYIGIPEKEYCEDFFNNNEEISDDEKEVEDIINGIGVLLFYNNAVDLNSNMTEYRIYDELLALDYEENIECSEFVKRLEEYRVCPIGSDIFDLKYNEDAKRLLCALVCKKKNSDLCNLIYEFVMLESSRSVVDIMYSVIELKNDEMIFLQIYRALEYLFAIVRAKDYSDTYDISLDKTVNLIIKENIWFQERLSVQVLVEKSSIESRNAYCDYLKSIGIEINDEAKKTEVLTKYIYDQRCKIAHYRYMHEPLKDAATLNESSVCLLKLVISLFQELDSSIITINEDNEVWEEMTKDGAD